MIAVAQRFGGELQSISIKEGPSHFAETVGEVMEEREEFDKYSAKVTVETTARAKEAGLEMSCTVLSGHEVETIVCFAREGHFDLLVIGFMGHNRVCG